MKSGVSLQQMLTEVKRQSESKEDYLIAPNRLRMESYGKEMFLHLSDDSGTELIEPMTITGIAHRQIGTHLRIPAAYYDRMRAARRESAASHRQCRYCRCGDSDCSSTRGQSRLVCVAFSANFPA